MHHLYMLPRLLACLALVAGFLPTARAEAGVLEGQVVCSQCWFEADRTREPYGSPDDLACAARCSAAGVPAALATRAGHSFELLLLGEPPAGGEPWLDLVGRFVRIQGEVEEGESGRTVRAAGIELLETSPWADMEPAVSPTAAAGSLSWPDLSGQPLSLESLRGRVVVLNFWATWCVPCREEMPELVRVQDRYGILGVQVIGAAADAVGQSEAVLEFAREQKLNFPVALGADTRQMQALGLGAALPATVVLDRDGRVVERFNGVFDPDDLETAIEEALSVDSPHGEPTAAHDEKSGHVHVASAGTQGSLVPS